jgi:hypothetical protein
MTTMTIVQLDSSQRSLVIFLVIVANFLIIGSLFVIQLMVDMCHYLAYVT